MYEELIYKAKTAKSVQELFDLAKENGIEMTEESAKAYYDKMNQLGELADEELDNVSGGGCHHDGKLVVSALHYCDEWICHKCGKSQHNTLHGHRCDRAESQEKSNMVACCGSCKYCIYEDSLWLCVR